MQTDINRLIEEYGKKVYNFCLRLCKSTYDADDLYQDTFLKAMEKISSIDENNNPGAYLCSIAVSLWKSKLRKEKRRQEIAPVMPIEEEIALIPTDGIEEGILKREFYAEIKTAVSELDDNLRQCVVLHYIAKMSLAEISQTLQIPEGTVKSRLHTARSLLKQKIAKGEAV